MHGLARNRRRVVDKNEEEWTRLLCRMIRGERSIALIEIRNEKEEDYGIVEEITRKAFYNLYIPGCTEHYLVYRRSALSPGT